MNQTKRRIEGYHQLRRKMERRINFLAVTRFVVFVLLLVALSFCIDGSYRLYGMIGAALSGGLFFFLMVLHDRYYRFKSKCDILLTISQNDLARANYAFRDIAYEDPVIFPDDHAFAHDLDLSSGNSLLKLIDDTFHKETRRLLQTWIDAPPNPESIRRRQQAVAELRTKKGFRLRLGMTCRLGGKPDLHADALNDWLSSPRPWTIGPAAYIFGRITSLITTGTLILSFVPDAPNLPLFPVLGFQLLVFYFFDFVQRGFCFSFMNQGGAIAASADIIRIFERIKVSSPLLTEMQAAMRVRGKKAGPSLAQLIAIHDALQVRTSGLGHLLLNILFLWDQHHLRRLYAWRREYGDVLPLWLDHIFELEALSALANFHWLNPTFPFPEILDDNSEIHLEVRGMGHPCIPEDIRVGNDFRLDKKGMLFLVTGSNMSGKSTFLRTIGINQILTRLGAPVCAASLTTTLPKLWTSIRIQDSLAEGVSYFYAEVKRLKMILDDIAVSGQPTLYLLDEILKGTNSRERLIASKALARYLIQHQASGLITTHDLELLALHEQYPDAIINCHFQEELRDEEMFFDYKLKPGRLTSTNALRVIQFAGVPLDLT